LIQTSLGRPGLAARLSNLAGWRRFGLALTLGAVSALALPPVHAIPLLWLCFPPLVWLIDGARRDRAAFAAGWWFGFGHFSAGLYWIANAMLVDAERFGWMIPFAIFGLGGLLGIFPGLAAVAARRSPPGVVRVLLLAAAWTFLEWVRGWLFTGFPWNLLGSVWLPALPVAQFAAVGGTLGLSLLTVACAAMPSVLAFPGGRPRLALAGSLALLGVLALWGGSRIPAGPVPMVPDVRLRLVQADIPQTLKWSPELRAQHFLEQLQLTASPGLDGISDVIWPETAAPSFLDHDPVARRMMGEATPKGGLIITGVVRGTAPGVEPFHIWNSLQAVDDRGDIVATYDKAHLVPFGEYTPFRDILPLQKITVGSVDFSSGPGPQTLALPGLPPASPLICYEAIFSGAVVDGAARPAWLLNVTNDGWFGQSAGPYQHFAAARLRAIEEGLPLVRAANTGISAVVDPYGRVIVELPLGRKGVIDSGLPVSLPVVSLFGRFGNSVPLLMVLLTVIVAFAWTRLFERPQTAKTLVRDSIPY
jgi:apolipoprotein N-acyltransferase